MILLYIRYLYLCSFLAEWMRLTGRNSSVLLIIITHQLTRTSNRKWYCTIDSINDSINAIFAIIGRNYAIGCVALQCHWAGMPLKIFKVTSYEYSIHLPSLNRWQSSVITRNSITHHQSYHYSLMILSSLLPLYLYW